MFAYLYVSLARRLQNWQPGPAHTMQAALGLMRGVVERRLRSFLAAPSRPE
jgi:hypothetical protein